jgi:C4-dicarboxylate-specific signal transduction histidine kinase
MAVLPETEFRQGMLNLLQNAVQAIGDQAGSVEVGIVREGPQLIITVSNTGAGFSDEFLQQGIRPFVSLKEKGSGLGLVMVQRFVREQRGNLKLENDEAGHARVTLSLPLAPA